MNEKCNKCWSLNEEDFFDAWCDLIDELVQQHARKIVTEMQKREKVVTQEDLE